MKSSRSYCIALVTVPNRRVARQICREVLERRAVACVNVIPGVESHYWWKGKIETGRELLLVMKTVRGRLRELERLVKENHPYENPEFVVFPLSAGSERYLAWIETSVRPVDT